MANVRSDHTADLSLQPSPGKRLDSWKEIAAYLKRDTATVRRWEKREALPVHRHHHEKIGSVYADTSELDAWLQGRHQRIGQHRLAGSDRVWRRIVLPAVLLSASLAAVLAYLWIATRATPADSELAINSLAVLPFQSLDDTARDEALRLGMTDALITGLAGVPIGIRVPPTSEVLKYLNARADVGAIGRELNVDAVVEGKIQRAADRIRVTVHLLRVRDGASLRAMTLDNQFTDIFEAEDLIRRIVVRELVLTVLTLRGEQAGNHTRRDTGRARGSFPSKSSR